MAIPQPNISTKQDSPGYKNINLYDNANIDDLIKVLESDGYQVTAPGATQEVANVESTTPATPTPEVKAPKVENVTEPNLPVAKTKTSTESNDDVYLAGLLSGDLTTVSHDQIIRSASAKARLMYPGDTKKQAEWVQWIIKDAMAAQKQQNFRSSEIQKNKNNLEARRARMNRKRRMEIDDAVSDIESMIDNELSIMDADEREAKLYRDMIADQFEMPSIADRYADRIARPEKPEAMPPMSDRIQKQIGDFKTGEKIKEIQMSAFNRGNLTTTVEDATIEELQTLATIPDETTRKKAIAELVARETERYRQLAHDREYETVDSNGLPVSVKKDKPGGGFETEDPFFLQVEKALPSTVSNFLNEFRDGGEFRDDARMVQDISTTVLLTFFPYGRAARAVGIPVPKIGMPTMAGAKTAAGKVSDFGKTLQAFANNLGIGAYSWATVNLKNVPTRVLGKLYTGMTGKNARLAGRKYLEKWFEGIRTVGAKMGDASVLANIRRGTQLPGRKTAPGVPAVAKSVDDIPKSARPIETDIPGGPRYGRVQRKYMEETKAPKVDRDFADSSGNDPTLFREALSPSEYFPKEWLNINLGQVRNMPRKDMQRLIKQLRDRGDVDMTPKLNSPNKALRDFMEDMLDEIAGP